jgi:hypothetical protein
VNRNPERDKKQKDGHRGRVRESEGEEKLTITGLGVQLERAGKLYNVVRRERCRCGEGAEESKLAPFTSIFSHMASPLGHQFPVLCKLLPPVLSLRSEPTPFEGATFLG